MNFCRFRSRSMPVTCTMDTIKTTSVTSFSTRRATVLLNPCFYTKIKLFFFTQTEYNNSYESYHILQEQTVVPYTKCHGPTKIFVTTIVLTCRPHRQQWRTDGRTVNISQKTVVEIFDDFQIYHILRIFDK